ncbi:unnamed protein product, partial [Rotaria socialis]
MKGRWKKIIKYVEINEPLKKRRQIVGLKDTLDNADRAEASIENQLSKHYTHYTEDAIK